MTVRPWLSALGLWAALVALGAQLAFGATLPQPVLAMIAFGRLCQADAAEPMPSRHSTRHVPANRVSVLCIAHAIPTPPLTAVRHVHASRASLYAERTGWQPISALPVAARRTAPARGPPSLV